MDQALEKRLVQRSLEGDTDAFQALAQRYYRPVAAFLLRRVSHSDVAEDLVQETFLEAFRALRQGSSKPQRFSSWLFGIAANCAGKWLRKRRPLLFDPADPPELPAVPPEINVMEEQEVIQQRLAQLDANLANLPADQRQLLQMKHRQGLTCEQMAERLGRPVGTIKSLLSRTYKLLRERLCPTSAEDGP